MKDYSIEYSSQSINSEKTKEYFKEVSSSYFNNNYRAAVVTLYSVVINDIIVKLETLDEIYSDPSAKSILDEVKTAQLNNPSSSEWEKEIIEKVKTRTNLIDNVDYAHFKALRDDRHLCAHPVLNKEDKLYTPNKETVASHIRNMLESFFLKPPILSKKILSTILIDISLKKDLLIDEISLEKYLKSKYLANLNSTIEISIFRDLWKFVFKLDDEPSESNRLINYRFLSLLYKRNTAHCIQKIKSEKEYFSNILNSSSTLNLIIRFLSYNEFLFDEFREDLHLLINQQTTKDADAKTVAWFLNETYHNHLEILKPIIINDFQGILPYNTTGDATNPAYKRLIEIGISKGHQEDILDFIIWRYANSKNYYDGNKIFSNVVLPFLNLFKKNDFENLCEQINGNSQTYDRWQAADDHRELKKIIITNIGNNFDFTKYPNIFQ